ncbi:MAG: recombinase family protein [Defluviitaleaceae bacterium]|nr:recombinase family protein [Defluviitaleaceae bacterium]
MDGTFKQESNSVGNQRALLDDFINNNPDFADYEVLEFLDDGCTGTNFSRPGVQKLLEAAETGKIQCIVVKDLSRFGRRYLDVGDYIEQKFPLWGVRFISLGDMYDSATLAHGATGGISMAFRGLIAQLYSQDLSAKVRSGKDAASRSGKIVTSFPTYGYNFDKNNRHKFVINDNEASVVQKIYNLYEQGVKVSKIARLLSAENITTPQASKRARGYDSKTGRDILWHRGIVASILRNEKYTGKWIYGKTRVPEIGSKRAYPVPKSEWIVVDGAIPVIISQEQFDRVQKLLGESQHMAASSAPEKSMFAGKIKCGFCGYSMTYSKLKAGRVYRCAMKKESAKFDCNTGKIEEQIIYNVVMTSLHAILLLSNICNALEGACARRYGNSRAAPDYRETSHSKMRAAHLSVENINLEKMTLWEDFHNGKISRESFQNKSKQLSDKVERHEKKGVTPPSQTNNLIGGVINCITALTKELVGEMVNKIRIYSPQRVEIEWTWGVFI